MAAQWKGDPQAVAELLGCDARAVARHYRRNRKSRTFDDWDFVESLGHGGHHLRTARTRQLQVSSSARTGRGFSSA